MQCRSPGGVQTVSPGTTSTTSPSRDWISPRPSVQGSAITALVERVRAALTAGSMLVAIALVLVGVLIARPAHPTPPAPTPQ